MAENVKQEIPETRGTFEIRGIITRFDKGQEYEKTTKKGNGMRIFEFNVDTAEGHSHRLRISAYQTENVYVSKTEVDKNGVRKNDTKAIPWANRDKVDYEKEGYNLIDRFRMHYGKDEEKGTRITENLLPFDAIPKLIEEFNVGDSVFVRGNIQIEEYTGKNGNTANTVRMIPNQMFHAQTDIDFNAEDFVETATFSQHILIDEIENSGKNELTVTGLIIGNRKIGRQDFIVRDEVYKTYESFFDIFGKGKKYTCVEIQGTFSNSYQKASEEIEYIDLGRGVKIPKVVSTRPVAGNYLREFVVTSVITGENGEKIDVNTYNEDNVQEFIDNFIKAQQEFGESTNKVEDDNKIEDFLF